MRKLLTRSALILAAAVLAACGRTHRSSETSQKDAPAASAAAVTPPGPGPDIAATETAPGPFTPTGVASRRIEWQLTDWDLQADLAADRPIVRTRIWLIGPTGLIGARTLKAAAESRIATDTILRGAEFTVQANDEGEIELGGTARTTEQVGRAIVHCLETEGVGKVVSRVRLEQPPEQP